jgi:hypothetical protein
MVVAMSPTNDHQELRLEGVTIARGITPSARDTEGEWFVASDRPAPCGAIVWIGMADEMTAYYVVRTIEVPQTKEPVRGNLLRLATDSEREASVNLRASRLSLPTQPESSPQ